MNPKDNNEKKIIKESLNSSDKTSPDESADKSGTDTNSDKTRIIDPEKERRSNRYDKPKREIDPDSTGIDINSDKTKKENK